MCELSAEFLEASTADLRALGARSLALMARGSSSILSETDTACPISEVGARKLNLWCRCAGLASWLRRVGTLGLSQGCDVAPSLSRLLKVFLLVALDHVERVEHLTVCEDVVAAVDLFLGVLVADPAQGHLVDSLLLSEALLSGDLLELLAHFVSLLFVPLTSVSFIEALLVLHDHVDRVVHQTVANN